MKVFLDTGPIIAFNDSRDQHHNRALETFIGLREARLLTTIPILTEAASRCSTLIGAQKSAFFLRQYLSSPHYTILEAGKTVYAAALELMVKYGDQGMSPTDCTSVLFMEALGIRKIFTFDRAFHHLGFQVIP